MTRWVFRRFGGPIEADAVTSDALQPGAVRLRVLACGVCHTDIHTWEGRYDLGGGRELDLSGRVKLPLALGHEVAGEVVACGPGVQASWLGRRCVVYPWIGCGQCTTCAAGQDPFCAKPRYLGIDQHGGFAHEVTVPDPRYLVPFDRLTPQQAAPLACSGLTAWAALDKAGPLGAEEPLLIIGAGGVGLAALGQARARWTAPIVVIDLDEGRLRAAAALGADHTVVSDGGPATLEALRHLLPQGFRAAIDFVGRPATFELSWSVLRKGGRMVVVGLFGGEARFPLPMLPARSLSLLGSYVGSLEQLHELVQGAERGEFSLPPAHPRPLASAWQCLCELREGRGLGRFVLVPEGAGASG
jgi:D-arabinose 1-dehydrogenase-like Zn-dependent alcohol dehydrogenase